MQVFGVQGIDAIGGSSNVTELTIRSDRADAAKSELEAALEGQRRVVQESIKRTRTNLTAFEYKYGFTTHVLLAKEADGSLDDGNLELIEWIGEARMLGRLQCELELLDEIRVCS